MTNATIFFRKPRISIAVLPFVWMRIWSTTTTKWIPSWAIGANANVLSDQKSLYTHDRRRVADASHKGNLHWSLNIIHQINGGPIFFFIYIDPSWFVVMTWHSYSPEGTWPVFVIHEQIYLIVLYFDYLVATLWISVSGCATDPSTGWFLSDETFIHIFFFRNKRFLVIPCLNELFKNTNLWFYFLLFIIKKFKY